MTVPRIGIAGASDERVLGAARKLVAGGRVCPVLVGAAPELPGVPGLLPEPGQSDVDALAELVGRGEVAAGVAGTVATSASVIRTGIRRLAPRGLVTGCFAIRHVEGWKTYADCSVIPAPTSEQLAEIGEAAADHHAHLFGEPARVAMLSFSTDGSAEHPDVLKVREATRLLRARRPELQLAGEVQFDVAVDGATGRRKLPGSDVAGRANVLIFPDLDAGNIAYKVAERVGRARALGSFVLNLSRPWVDLSRGCAEADIVDTVLLLADALRRSVPHGTGRDAALATVEESP